MGNASSALHEANKRPTAQRCSGNGPNAREQLTSDASSPNHELASAGAAHYDPGFLKPSNGINGSSQGVCWPEVLLLQAARRTARHHMHISMHAGMPQRCMLVQCPLPISPADDRACADASMHALF